MHSLAIYSYRAARMGKGRQSKIQAGAAACTAHRLRSKRSS